MKYNGGEESKFGSGLELNRAKLPNVENTRPNCSKVKSESRVTGVENHYIICNVRLH